MTDNRTTELRISEPLRGFIRHQSNRAYIDGGQARWLTEIADEIEAEIAERYIELPCDADGVPIRIGDTVREMDDCVPMKVMSLTFYEDCVDVNACGMNPKLLFHVKPRTIEDVLTDFANEVARQGHQIGLTGHELTMRYAAEIRELMEVDA